jgi:hypothetical protein
MHNAQNVAPEETTVRLATDRVFMGRLVTGFNRWTHADVSSTNKNTEAQQLHNGVSTAVSVFGHLTFVVFVVLCLGRWSCHTGWHSKWRSRGSNQRCSIAGRGSTFHGN